MILALMTTVLISKGIAMKLAFAAILAMSAAASACATAMPHSYASAASPQQSFDCVKRVAASKGYDLVKRNDADVLLLAHKRRPFVGKEAITRVMSFGFVSADQGKEDRLLVTQSSDYLRVDAVGVLPSGSDAPATLSGRRDAAELLNACAANVGA
jgi:hypothetical protein